MKLQLKIGVESSAVFGGRHNEYRYLLRRLWEPSLPCLAWVMLNPSTADADSDDPTVAKCQTYARLWGYGSIVVANLFALRSPSPMALRRHKYPTEEEGRFGTNGTWIIKACQDSADVICAWGNDGAYLDRGNIVLGLIREFNPQALVMTKTGQPGHPLYLRLTAQPLPIGAPNVATH